MSTILEKENISKAKEAVNDYKTTCDDLYKQMEEKITNLVKSGFIGEASSGYQTFITNISPALTTQLTGAQNSLTTMLIDILDSVENGLIETVDPELGNNNKSAISNTQNTSVNNG